MAFATGAAGATRPRRDTTPSFMSQLRILLLTCALLALWMGCAFRVHAQDTPLPGLYAPGALPLQVYGASEYPGTADNWAIAPGPEGRVFVGNGVGVYAIRGQHVSDLITLDNRSVARSLHVGPGGLMYVGGSNEVGYLVPTANGSLRYTSLLSYVPEEYRDFQDVWLVQTFGASVFFYSYRQVMRWTPATAAMKVWHFDEVVTLIKDAPEPVLQTMGDGRLHTLSGDDEWQPFFSAPDVLTHEPARLLLPRVAGDSVLVTGRGLYRLTGGKLYPQASAVSTDGRRRWVYDAVPLPGGHLAVATLYEGVLILDADGALVRQFSKAQGLPDNVALALAYDAQGYLWIALERGLARVDLGSDVTTIEAREGLGADADAMALHEGALYVGGIEQLARIASAPGMPLETVATPADDVLALLSTPQGLIVGMRKSLQIYRQGRLAPVADFRIDGDYPVALLRSRVDTTKVYVGYRRGLATLRLRDGRWTFAGTLPAVTADVASLAEEDDGTLWLGTNHEDLWRVSFEGGVARAHRYGPSEGMPRLIVAPLQVDGQMLFFTSAGFYRPGGAGITRDSSALAAALDYAPRDIADAHVAPGGDVYLVVDGQPGVARRAGTQYRWEPVGDATLQRDATLRTWLLGGHLWLSQTNRLARLSPGPEAAAGFAEFQTYIESVRLADRDSVLYGGVGTPALQRLAARQGLEFVVGAPRYEGVQYRYRLDGLDAHWSAWTSSPQRNYPVLPAGAYTFRAQAQDRHGIIGQEAVVAFEVAALWYRSRGMVAVYGVLALLLVLACVAGATRWQEHRSEAARRLLAAKVRVHTREAEAQKRMLRYLNKTLQESNTRLEEMSAQKSHLLSIAAHDLKTPIANIYSLAEILLEERDEGPANYEFLDLIRTSARQMSKLIDDVLNSEARETGQLRLNPVRADLRALASQAVQQCTVQAERKGQIIRLHVVPPELAFETEVDELRVLDAMVNLVNNAVKYSRLHAVIEVYLTRTDDAFRFEVRDEGPGVREEDRDGLFQPFQRLSAQPTGGESSSGMGLYIVRQYVEMHNGHVGVESFEGVGSIFWFTLPAPVAVLTPAATPVGAESGSPA